jgi:hypothetical protein
MGAITDLWKSERGLLCLALIIAASVLAVMSVLTKQDWLDYTKWIFITYVAGKSVTSAVETMKGSSAPAPAPEARP